MTLYGLTPADQGTYTVLQLDTRRALSTVQLTVHARRENATLPAGADLSIPLLSGAGDAQVRFEPAGAGGVAEPVFALRGGRVRLRLQYQLRVRRQPGALLLSGVTPADQGTYSLWQMDTERLLSSVQLSVEARRDTVTLQAGASLSVPLLTGEPVEVLFDPAGSGDWTSVCSVQSSTASCVPQYRDRVSVDNQELRLQELRASDQGSYTVRDLQGNTISTVIVTVEAPPPGQSSGLVAGTVVGVLILLVLVAGGLLLWGRRRRRRAEKAKRPDFRLQCRASPDQEEELSAEAEHRGGARMTRWLFILCALSCTDRACCSAALTVGHGDDLALPLRAGDSEVEFRGDEGATRHFRVRNWTLSSPPDGLGARAGVRAGALVLHRVTAADEGQYTTWHREAGGEHSGATYGLKVEAYRRSLRAAGGASVSLPLFTERPAELLFRPAAGGAPGPLCSVRDGLPSCPPPYGGRVSARDGHLVLGPLGPEDAGLYTLRYPDTGRDIGTVELAVSLEDPKAQTEPSGTRGRVPAYLSGALFLFLVGVTVAVVLRRRARAV
ncbi:uncharacterized protein [Lepisosteus oculatus]|uniref:uncharacterized protein n=1 Tax=Lepisosteus oculatus TaxID=7918 RepID=UPI0035F505E4